VLGLLIYLCACGTAVGQTGFSVQPYLHHFSYKEFSDSGRLLDREDGYLPGLLLSVARDVGAWQAGLSAKYMRGKVDYNGQTQTGAPHTTQTEETMQAVTLRVARRFMPEANAMKIYAAWTYHQWERDILSKNNVLGLFEVYRWQELALGWQLFFIENHSHTLAFDMSFLRVADPQMTLDLGYGESKFQLGEENGGRVSIFWDKQWRPEQRLGAQLYLEYWRFGASKPVGVNFGSSIISFIEPDSKTQSVGMRVVYAYQF
jgi:hypothetical protein